MPPPPPSTWAPVPGKTPDEHRAYKTKKANELANKILAEQDPMRRHELEQELSKRSPHHYDLPAQPAWPLHNWPYQGPEFTRESIPKSHFIARRHLPPEEQCYARPSYAIDKYMVMQEGHGMHFKYNPRRRVWQIAFMVGLPMAIFHCVKYVAWQRDARAGRIPTNNGVFHNLAKKHRILRA